MTTDPYTAERQLCDNTGLVSNQRVEPGSPGTLLDPELTYRQLLNNLRRHGGQEPYTGKDFRCTGSAHLAREHFRCTSPAHTAPADNPAPTLAAAQAEWLHEFVGYARNEIADGAVDTGDQQAAAVMDDILTVLTAAANALNTVGMRTGIRAHLDLVEAVATLAQSFAAGLEYTQEYPR